MADLKMTKAMWLEEIKGVVEAADYENKEGAIEFINKQIETLAAKAEKAKVTARLTALVNAGIAKKEPVKVGSRKVMAYSLV